MGHSLSIVQEKRKNYINISFLYLLNLTKMVLKNRNKFEYTYFTYLTLYFTWRCMVFSSFVREMREQLAWALFVMLKLRF